MNRLYIYFMIKIQCLQTNEIEVHFAVGEALADCSLGNDSSSGRNLWTDDDPTQTSAESMDEVRYICIKLF